MCNCFPINNSASSLAHTILFLGQSLELHDLTFVNGCNIDFEYEGKLYKKTSDVITQAYAFGAWNSKSIKAYSCRFLSVLDTLDLRNVEELQMQDCYTMGNNDFIGIADKTYYNSCDFKILGTCPMWSSAKKQLIFCNCHFDVDVQDEENTLYFTKRGGNLFLISCDFTSKLANLQMEISLQKTSRYYLFNNSWNNMPLPLKGIDETFVKLTYNDVAQIKEKPLDDYFLAISKTIDITDTEVFDIIGGNNDFLIKGSDHLAIKKGNHNIIVKNELIGEDTIGYILIKSGFLQAITYFKQIGKKQDILNLANH